ncbi:MAG TPA: glyoxylate/hydroxypyruvate reductase A [Stellaceae bacterium]|nr:glyoxylate/hydroxypyruvate reductase A [Stellaceae bacterium]
MALLFRASGEGGGEWVAPLRAAMPDEDIRFWPDVGDPAEIDAALVWKPPSGWLATLPNLKAILSLGAGVDHILQDTALPAGVPIIRLVDPAMAEAMTEWIVLQVLRLHRQDVDYAAQQRERVWRRHDQPLARERRIGILGLGTLGCHAGQALRSLGFDVAGWSRSRKSVPDIASFAGLDELESFLARTDILVLLLPLTADTDGLLNSVRLAQLPRGAGIVNAARGRHIVDEAVLTALGSGHISAAVLDVFQHEPLPPEHPYWSHPRVVVSPHAAAATDARSASVIMSDTVRRLRSGAELIDRVEPGTGY